MHNLANDPPLDLLELQIVIYVSIQVDRVHENSCI